MSNSEIRNHDSVSFEDARNNPAVRALSRYVSPCSNCGEEEDLSVLQSRAEEIAKCLKPIVQNLDNSYST
jgi:hypothetical protein